MSLLTITSDVNILYHYFSSVINFVPPYDLKNHRKIYNEDIDSAFKISQLISTEQIDLADFLPEVKF